MLKLTLRGLRAHKLRYLLTGLAVVLGVAFMAGTMVLTDTMEKTFNGVISTANEGTDVIVRQEAAIDGDFTAARERIDASVVDQIAGVEGVEAARGSIQGFAELVLADGSVAAQDGIGASIGANWIDDERLNPFDLSSGAAPAGPDEAVLDKRTAEAEGWTLGDRFTVLTKAGPTELTLVGTASYGDIDGIPGASLIATTDETAQALFAEPGRYDLALVAAADGVTADDLKTRIDGAVSASGSGLESITGDDDTAEQQADLKDDLSFFNSFLMAFAYVALFVGTFIIYNTFSIVVAQRTKEMAMLRAIGARRNQVLRSIVLESVVVGVLAAAVGLVAGIGLSFGLRALLGMAGLDIPSGSLVLSTSTVMTAFAVGVTVSVVSAIAPAVRASKVRPIAALRDVAVDRSGVSLKRAITGLLLTGAGVTAFAAGVVATGEGALSLIGFGVALVVVGMVTSGPVLVRPVLRLFGAPIAASGITGRYARENAHRNPKRTAATASALMIGVALVGFITILASSTTSSVEAAVDKSFRADYVVDSGSWDQGFATSIEDDLRNVEGVETLSPLRNAPVEVAVNGETSTTTLQGMDTTVLDQLYDLEVTSGSLADVHGDGVALAVDSANNRGLALGDSATFGFADGDEVELTVRALYDGEIPDGGDSSWLVGLDTFEAHVTDQFDRKVFLTVTDGTDATDARAALEGALTGWPNAEIQDQAEFKAAVTEEIQQILNLIYGLLALAVVIALIGIANTLALSIHERTPELGLLRSIGMQRRQLKRAVRWEALMIAVIGAVMGGVLAIGGAYGIVTALDSEGVTQLTIPVTQMVIILGLAGLAGVLAAGGPARRAARLDPLEAITQ